MPCSVTILASRPDVAARYRERFRWVCVDEYQDVDELQYRLLRLLCPPTGPDGGNLCAIGDPDQAIYGFRGADVGFFLRFREDYPAARLVALTRNYRSSPAIVASALAAIAPSTLVPDRALHAMRQRNGDGARITVRATADADSEARFVVHTIEELLGGATFHAHDSGRVTTDGVHGGLSFDDIAILYRTGAQARPLMAALAKEGLPFQRRSHDRLRDHPGVRTLLPYVSSISDSSTTALLKSAGAKALQDVEGDDERTEEIRAALELLGPLAARHTPDMFLAELALGSEVDTWDPRANRISLLTLHAAKGLEFPVVFIVGCADGLLPLRWPGEDDDDSEERRLFFVGVSRAQSHLYLSYPLRDNRSDRDLRASAFLSAFDDSLADRVADPTTGRSAKRANQLTLL
ncbi:MAG TPA: ATP-dependent helicase [Pseudonocardiaceae bacterium]